MLIHSYNVYQWFSSTSVLVYKELLNFLTLLCSVCYSTNVCVPYMHIYLCGYVDLHGISIRWESTRVFLRSGTCYFERLSTGNHERNELIFMKGWVYLWTFNRKRITFHNPRSSNLSQYRKVAEFFRITIDIFKFRSQIEWKIFPASLPPESHDFFVSYLFIAPADSSYAWWRDGVTYMWKIYFMSVLRINLMLSRAFRRGSSYTVSSTINREIFCLRELWNIRRENYFSADGKIHEWNTF